MHSSTVEELLQPYLQYPVMIQRAILLVETNPRFLCLTRCMKKVLKTLLTRTSKIDGTKEIRARVDTVAFQAAVSTKTVQRTLCTLRELGWISQTSDGRSEEGCFTSRRYAFSASLCEIVALPCKKVISTEETILSDGAVYVDLSFKKDQQAIRKQNQEQRRLKNDDAKKIQLPEELRAIEALGVKDTGVAKLRGMAFASGYDLADVFCVAKERLQELKASGGRVYRYLAAMINNPKPSDYAARARQITRTHIQRVAQSKFSSRREKYRYRRFSAGPGTVVRIFDGTADVTRDGTWVGVIAGRDMDRVYDDIEAGRLQAFTN